MSRRLFISLGLVIIFFLCGCVAIYNPATQQKEYYFIDEESEVNIGKNMAERITKENKIIDDQKTASYVNKIGERIVKASDRPDLEYKFYAIDEDEMNAFALPGGHVFINKGLIEKASEDELAFVMGHEIGHISARHSVKRLQNTLGISILLGIALRNPNHETVRGAINVVYNVVALGYSRRDELLADSLGLKYMYNSGYDPKAAVSLLGKLEREDKGNNQLVFLRSHPQAETRRKNLEVKIKALGDF